MKVLFIGDPHLKITKFDLSKKFLAWVESVIRDEKPDLVVNLGDTFHTHAVVRSEIMAEFTAHVRRVTEQCEYVYLLGNHDMFKPDDATYHTLLPLKGNIEGFTVIDEITDLYDMTFVPYMHDWQNFPKQPNHKICIAHQTFVGADYGYYRPDVGVDADKIDADIIISGHVHKRQSFGKVNYPGTPYSQGLDDINQCKGIVLFDTATYGFRFISSPFPLWKGARLSIDDETTIDDAHEHLCSSVNDTDHLVVELTGPRAEIVSYMDSKRWHELSSKYSIRIKPEYNDKSKISNKKIKAVTMQEIVCEYVDNIYSGSLDKEVIKARALQVLDNASEK